MEMAMQGRELIIDKSDGKEIVSNILANWNEKRNYVDMLLASYLMKTLIHPKKMNIMVFKEIGVEKPHII